jgi:hypothetical protein
MEPLWSPAVATSGNGWQTGWSRNGSDSGKTVAAGCDPLRPKLHGKEGVDGSSPSEGSAKAPQSGASSFRCTCMVHNVRWVWSPSWSLQVEKSLCREPKTATLGATT